MEGIDDLINWEMAKSQHVPMAVLNQMESPHMVVVRAAHEEMSLGDVLDIIQWQHGRNKGSHSKVNENSGMAVHPHPGDFEAEPTHNRTSALQAQATANAYVEYMPLKDESLLRLFTHITNLGAEQRHQQQSVDQADYDTQRVVGDLLTEDVARKSRNNQVDRTADSNGERNYLNVALRNSMEDTSMHVLARHANWMKYLIEGKGHMWIGDGYTVGKLHFDPYDNILLQVEGAKRFRLVDPSDNTRMYEGHMREAELEAVRLQAQKQSEGSGECNKSVSTHDNSMIHNTTRKVCRNHGRSPWEYRFRKRKLSESTSMVHSPVDVNELYDAQHTHKSSADNDNTKRRRHNSKYPKASGVNTIDCVVEKGDALWVPSFWWHEVKSYPGDTNAYRTDPLSPEADAADKDDLSRNVITSGSLYPLNIAVNFWFAPLYDKEFPCASCKKSKLNQKYADVLRDLTASNLLE
ncbi:unnamed protein product [Symbiodinium microadriaticum]|nr:unnamed protein product [Symbiodinium microadriaticum]